MAPPVQPQPLLRRNPQPPRPPRLPPSQNPRLLLRPQPRRSSKPQFPAVKKFAALPSSAKSRAKIILTSLRFPAPAPADASARVTSSARCKEVAQQRLLQAQLRLPHHHRPAQQEFHQPPAAPAPPRV